MGATDGRYAPSPSGTLHLGNLRTALLAWLRARSTGGAFRLRIDDLDRQRSRAEHEAGQLADLRALGIDWDGPVPRQSTRDAVYAAAFERLREADLAYPCWCTRAEIREAAAAPHGPGAEGRYPGTCRDLDAAGRDARAAAAGGRPPAWRVRADGAERTIEDLVLGPVHGIVDDVVVRRGDGTFAYHLAVVLDDHEQGVREVVRGADLADSAPTQAWLAELLDVTVPRYAHVPLVLGPDGRRLAKRDGAVTLEDRRALGETAEDVRAALLSSVGLCAPDERPPIADLLARFDLAAIRGRGPTRWDPAGGPL
ncbi:tRNA glutamyl-Q(34) synthetase GluQRS [Patulibacter brassicae]|uniref:Glutamyl-Q tRNA(Asp) synthetase n=1 Tax=Patulibacter brassicae TaxID=1705717 RepID=A0ABU4VNT3_9ACTN|nr:tRNA glutamyl-Q(34) synthetase GluQRS [Patulibacter brassicae]MDX8153516.1 tRNA glutamyl-Q(34) synthetase GluQRS [Patulibacter brassicae]